MELQDFITQLLFRFRSLFRLIHQQPKGHQPAGIQKMANKLQADKKAELISLIQSDCEIPYTYLPLLFPHGDGNFGAREKRFCDQFHRLDGKSWTAFSHLVNPSRPPIAVFQAAWPWRREIWYVHFGCLISLERAYRHYRVGHYSDSNEFNEISRILIRYAHLVGALTLPPPWRSCQSFRMTAPCFLLSTSRTHS